jgi:hypothetical protein
MLKLAASAVGGSSLVRGAILGQVKDRISGAVSNVTQQAINWSDHNWPFKQMGFFHFDLAELKEKRPEHVHWHILQLSR